jgi:hypothetical protein
MWSKSNHIAAFALDLMSTYEEEHTMSTNLTYILKHFDASLKQLLVNKNSSKTY